MADAKSGALGSLSAVKPVDLTQLTVPVTKLTVLDTTRTFSAQLSKVSGSASIQVSYSNATVGANEFISALVQDRNGNIKYYGKLLKPTEASGSLTINLSGLARRK